MSGPPPQAADVLAVEVDGPLVRTAAVTAGGTLAEPASAVAVGHGPGRLVALLASRAADHPDGRPAVATDVAVGDEVAETLDRLGAVEPVARAEAVAWAEYRFGAARDARHVLTVVADDELGIATVLGGRLHRGRTPAAAGEAGHLQLVPGGLACGCGATGCWRAYAGAGALLATVGAGADAAALAGGGSAAARRVVDDVVSAAGDGSATALAALGQAGRALGQGLAALAALLDPEVIVLAGALAAAGDLVLTPARTTFVAELTGREYRVPARLVLAGLAGDAALLGVADLARQPPRTAGPTRRPSWSRRRNSRTGRP